MRGRSLTRRAAWPFRSAHGSSALLSGPWRDAMARREGGRGCRTPPFGVRQSSGNAGPVETVYFAVSFPAGFNEIAVASVKVIRIVSPTRTRSKREGSATRATKYFRRGLLTVTV